MLHFLAIGVALGLSAGMAPGPLLALVVAETLHHGVGAGIRVACAPFLTDLPIIAISLFALAQLTDLPQVLGLVSLAGGILLLYLGWQNLHTKETPLLPSPTPRPLMKGIAVNLFSPHPYLFWLGVGAPLTAKAIAHGLPAAIAFITGFYTMLVGSKMALATATGKSRAFLSGPAYRLTLRLLGLSLCLLAFLLLRDAYFALR